MNPLLTLANTVNVIKASGLGSLTDDNKYVVAGTTIQWGGNPTWGGVSALTLAEMRGIVAGLYGTGLYEYVGTEQLGGYLNPYFQVTVKTAIDRARLRDVIDDIEHVLYEAGVQPGTNAYIVSASPATNSASTATAGAGNYQQTSNAGGAGGQQTNSTPPPCPNPSLFCQCGYEFSLFDLGCVPVGDPTTALDKLAKSLGVTPTQAAIVGAGAALLAVIAIGKVVK